MRRFNKLLKSGTSLMLVFAMLLGMCSTAIAVGETKSTENSYVALGDFVTEDALKDFAKAFAEGTVVYGGFKRIVDLYNDDLNANLEDIKAADVIALGIGNADINIHAVNNILGAIGKDVVDIGSVDYGTLEDALANCDALTRNAAMQVYDNLYGKLESAISERVTDAKLVTTLLDILVYTAVSFVVNYSAMLEEIATVNDDATVMIVGLVNMMDGMAIKFNGQEIELGKYFGYVMEALNVYLAAVPTAMQMNGDYENVTFLYADASDVEAEYVAPTCVDGISEVVEKLVWGDTLQSKLTEMIPGDVNGVTVNIQLEDENGKLTAFGKQVFDAICLELQKAILAVGEPNPIVLSTDINLGGLFDDVNINIDTDALTELAMEHVLGEYSNWQKNEGKDITDACYNFMLGKVETVKVSEDDVWEELHNKYPELSDEQIRAALEAEGKTIADLVAEATDKAKADAVALLGEYKENLPLALLKIADDLVEFPTEPVDVNAWVVDMRAERTKEKAEVEGLVNGWVSEVAGNLIVNEIDAVLPEVFAGDDMNSLLYLLGRLLVGDGLGRYPTYEGSQAICAAMVAAYYGDGEDDPQNTVQNEISNKVKKLIDLVLQNGPQAMNKVNAFDKIRAALEKMVEKLGDRGGDKVHEVIGEIKFILDEMETIAKGESDKTAEDLVNLYIDLDTTIEELQALIKSGELPADSEGAIREFIEAAAHGDYEIDYESYYVAIGDDSAEGYAELLAAELGLSNDFEMLVSDSVATSVENLDAEVIEKADLITVGFSGNTFFKYMASQMNAYLDSDKEPEKMDWSIYVGEQGSQYVERAMAEIRAVLVAQGLDTEYPLVGINPCELLMLAIESYAYASADYLFNYPTLIKEIREINHDALIVSVGMNNATADITLNLGEEYGVFALGEYIGYLIAALNGEAKIFAMLNENMVYVHAPDVPIEAGAGEYDNMGILDFVREIGNIGEYDGFAGLETSKEGNEYIKKQIYNALNITHGLQLGNVNFDEYVNIFDALDLLDIIAADTGDELSDVMFGVSNINGDEVISILDAVELLDMIASRK